MSGLKPGPISETRATAKTIATAKEEADPCGMTARKARATARTIQGLSAAHHDGAMTLRSR
jgi:hypothetical protein